MYLFQEVGKPELGFPNHEFIQLWTGQVHVRHESFQSLYERGCENQFRFSNFLEESFSEISIITFSIHNLNQREI